MKLMRMSRLILCTMLAITLLLAGCKSDSLTDEEKQFAVSETLPEATLTFYLIGDEKPDARLVLDEVEKRIKDKLNAHLVFKWIGFNQYSEKIKGAAADGDALDAFICGRPETYLNFDYIDMARKGELKDISELFPKVAPGLYSKYSEEELRSMKVDGKLYVVPSLRPSAYCTNVWVNKEFVQGYNIKPIHTLEDYTAFLKLKS